MSFFFSKKAKEPPKKQPHVYAAPKQRDISSLHRHGCKACPLNTADITTPKMEPTLGSGPIYFLAEAPGADEDENTGIPLTGPSGVLLRSCIPDGNGSRCSYDNIVNCRPPKNRTPVWIEIEACRPRRNKWIEQVKPKLIVGLGAIPLHWALGSTDLAGMRGRLFAIRVGTHQCWFLPTYHPSFILRTAFNKKKPLNSRLGHCFRMDIKRAFELVGSLGKVHIDDEATIRGNIRTFDGSVSSHYDELCALLADAREAECKAVDIETKGLRPFSADAAIMSAAVSFRDINFAFALEHPEGAWNLQQREKLEGLLERVLRDERTIKIAHNAPFEIEWFAWLYGNSVVNHAAWECTQMQAHFLDERRGKQGHGDEERRAPYQSLNFLCKQHFGVAFKHLFKMNKKDMSKSPLDEMLVYNAVDTKYTLRLWHRQTELLKCEGLYDAYLEASLRQPTVALMQTLGVPIDQTEIQSSQKRLGEEVSEIEAEISSLDDVRAYKAAHNGFNPLSNEDTVGILKDYLPAPGLHSGEGKTKGYSVDKFALENIQHPLAGLIVRLRNRVKMKSTYVDDLELGKGELIYSDGKLHTNFNTTFTETGRLSSDEPNLQNYPKRNDSWVRKSIVAPPGCLMVAVDYGQLEACTTAMCSKDEYLVHALWNDYDIHMEWAIKAAKKIPAFGKADKAFRALIKNKLTFPAFFGAANESVRDYLASATGVDVQQSDIDDLMDEFWGTFSGTKSWQDLTMKRYYDIGYVETMGGWRHRYPLTRNQAINGPVQGTAAEIVCDAMCRLSYMAVSTDNWPLHPILNVHDDLSFFVPEKGLENYIEIIVKQMLTFDFKWINTPLSVEVSIGPNWAELKDAGKYYSNKDL